MKNVSDLQLSSNSLLNWVLQGKHSSIEKEPYYVKSMLLNHLHNSFNEIKAAKYSEAKRVKLRKYRPEDYSETCLEEVNTIASIVRSNKKFFKYFVIHGSTSDLKTSDGWSDFDAMAVIKNKVLNKDEASSFINVCLKLDNVMRKIDKLQHHGIHFLHEKEKCGDDSHVSWTSRW